VSDNFEEKIESFLAELELSESEIRKSRDVDNYTAINATATESRDAIIKKLNPESGRILLVPLFDIHYGLKGCNYEILQSYIDYILNTKDCYTFLGGDSCETATRESVGLAMIEEVLHAGPQRRALTDLLRPLAEAGKILFGFPGNHEMRAHKFNEDNPVIEMCYDLGIPFAGYTSFVNIVVNNIPYQIIAHHGSGGGGTIGSKVNAAAKPGHFALADLYISGHSHVRAAWDDSFFEMNDTKVSKRRRVFVIGGSLVNYFEMYPEMKMLAPNNVGLVMISLSGTTKYVTVTL
jgi:hypothetical protein